MEYFYIGNSGFMGIFNVDDGNFFVNFNFFVFNLIGGNGIMISDGEYVFYCY